MTTAAGPTRLENNARRGARPWLTDVVAPIAWAIALFALLQFDTPLLRWYRSFDPPRWTTPVEDVTSDLFFDGLIVVGLFVAILSARRWRDHALLAMGLQFVAAESLKHLFGRVRPCHGGDGDLFLGPSLFHDSYPSGHSTAVWTLAFVFARRFPRLRPIWFGLALLMSWARLHADAHFVGDVLAGVTLAWVVERIAWRGSAWWIQRTGDQAADPPAGEPVLDRRALVWLAVVVAPGLAMFIRRPAVPPLPDDRPAAVAALYRQILRREPDAPGQAAYVEMLDETGTSMRLVKSLAMSAEFVDAIRDTPPDRRVDEIHRRVLDRPASPDEIAAATPLVAGDHALGHSVRALVLRLTISPEYLDRFGCFDAPGW